MYCNEGPTFFDKSDNAERGVCVCILIEPLHVPMTSNICLSLAAALGGGGIAPVDSNVRDIRHIVIDLYAKAYSFPFITESMYSTTDIEKQRMEVKNDLV